MSRLRPAKRTEQGQSMIELALTITILMVLLAGTIDMGRAFFTWLSLRDAAQEGASYGTFKPDDTAGIEARARSSFDDAVNDPSAIVSIDVDYSGPHCLGNPQSTITVTIDYQNFPITTPLLGTIVGGQNIPIRATVNDTILSPKCP